MTAPHTTTDRDEALAFIARMQADPATACAFVGTLDEGLADDLDGLDQPWLETLRVCRDDSGAITGAALLEWDEEVGMSWVHGPWATPETWDRDARALLEAVTAQAPVERHQVYGEQANTRLGELGDQLGWKRSRANHVYEVDRARLARPDAEVRPATEDDLPQLKELHEQFFPDTYAMAEQLIEPEAQYRTLVVDEGDQLLGYVTGRADGDGAYLDFVAVRPQARRRGIGGRLVGAMAELLPGDRLRLTVDESATEAIALYEKQGWTRRSTTRAWTAPAAS